MTSKEILLRLCKLATEQCKVHNVDVDFEKDLILHYIPGEYSIAVMKCNESGNKKFYNSHITIGINVPWHHEAYDKLIYNVHIFNSEVKMSDEAYDIILKYMLHGCKMTFDAKNIDELKREYDIKKASLTLRAKDLLASKDNNPNFKADAIAYQALFSAEFTSFNNKAYPEIAIVPKAFSNIEELQIWLDLQN